MEKKMMWCCFFFHLERNSVSACCYLCSTDDLKEYFLQMMDTAKSICCTGIWCSHNHLSYPFLLKKMNRNILISKRVTRLRNMKKNLQEADIFRGNELAILFSFSTNAPTHKDCSLRVCDCFKIDFILNGAYDRWYFLSGIFQRSIRRQR